MGVESLPDFTPPARQLARGSLSDLWLSRVVIPHCVPGHLL